MTCYYIFGINSETVKITPFKIGESVKLKENMKKSASELLKSHIRRIIKEERSRLMESIFTITVDLDERGEYAATVYNQTGKEVWSVDTESLNELIDDGFLTGKPNKDLNGLKSYLSDIGIMKSTDKIVNENYKLTEEKSPKYIELPKSNLIFKGFGKDTNGNKFAKLEFFDGTRSNIQTNGNLPNTHSLSAGKSKLSDFDNSDIQTISNEVIDYISNYGTKMQKSKLKVRGK